MRTPDKVWVHIFEFAMATPDDWIHVAHVCKVWTHALRGACYKGSATVSMARVKCLRGSLANASAVAIRGFRGFPIPSVFALPRLRRLDLRRCSVPLAAFSNLTALTDLDLRGCFWIEHFDAICQLSSLVRLRLSRCHRLHLHGLGFVSALQSLETLEMAGCRNLTLEGNQALVPTPMLMSLNLAHCRGITRAGLRSVWELTTLTHLNLAGCLFYAGLDLRELAALASLTHLNLCGVRGVWFDLQPLAGLTSLTYLDLSSHTNLNDYTLVHLASLTGLTHLDLSGCPQVCPTGARHLLPGAIIHVKTEPVVS
jgi:F-box/leucine-rich repeat protein 14